MERRNSGKAASRRKRRYSGLVRYRVVSGWGEEMVGWSQEHQQL
jgi:hypothetical protein